MLAHGHVEESVPVNAVGTEHADDYVRDETRARETPDDPDGERWLQWKPIPRVNRKLFASANSSNDWIITSTFGVR